MTPVEASLVIAGFSISLAVLCVAMVVLWKNRR
jgi:hypothetical protein